VQALGSFKKRHDDALRKVRLLQEQPQSVDFSHYRTVLKNTAVVDEIEKAFQNWKPVTYDVSRQIKAIEAFEAQAVKSAEETKGVVDAELRDLDRTLKNIEEARPFDQLTVDDVAAAQPEIDKRTEQLVSKGKWVVPGYAVSQAECKIDGSLTNDIRKNSAIFQLYRRLSTEISPLTLLPQ
jgi:ATP synthase D chain, mitochondrial (ATP5H)